MVIIDANAVLRVILLDNDEMLSEVKALIKHNKVLIKNEVLAEIIYVLMRVYKISREDVSNSLLNLLNVENIYVESKELILFAIKTFNDKNIDFVDSLLYSYYIINETSIFTFDKKLNKLISSFNKK